MQLLGIPRHERSPIQFGMHLIASAFATRRSRFTFALTAGTLALVIGLVVYGSLSRPTGYPGPKSFAFLLIPLSVYVVCRFARSAVMVPVLALLLLGAAVWSIPPLTVRRTSGGGCKSPRSDSVARDCFSRSVRRPR